MPESDKERSVPTPRRLPDRVAVSHINQPERDETYVLKAYSIIGVIALALFGWLHIVEGNRLLGYLELAFAGVVAFNALGFKLTRNLAVARTFFLTSITAVLLVLVVTGGTHDTGIFWLFVFPNLTFFLVGKKQGLIWVISLSLLTGLMVVLSQLSTIHIPYSLIEMRQLLASMAVVTFGVYIYQGARERALQEVHAVHRDLQEYLDHMTTFNVKISLSGTIVFANKVAKEASGLGERLIGTNFLEGPWWTFDDAVRRRVEAAFYKVLTGQPVNYDEKFKAVSTGGMSVLTVNFSMIPILDKNNRLSYVLAEARNISAEQEVDRAKSTFIGLASRQLQNPTAAALQLSGRLLTGDIRRLSEAQRQDIRNLYRYSQHMTTLINNMLLVSQLELGNLPVKPQPTDPIEISKTIMSGIKTTFLKDRKLEIQEEYADRLPHIPIDAEVLRIVLSNLVSNAVRNTPDTGRVYMRIRHIDETLQSDSKGSIQIEIQDSGAGIPRADQKKLFTKFFRASNDKAKVTEGAGLGLYIVKKLVEYVGGTVAFQSEENVGSIFIITLPIEGMRKQSTTTYSDNLS